MERITLKSVKHNARMSEETHCYSANVYFDGKRAGEVWNHGHGACDDYRVLDREIWDAMQAYIKTLPREAIDFPGHERITVARTLDDICCELVNEFLAKRDLKRALSKRVVYVQNGSLFQTNTCQRKDTLNRWIDQVKGWDGVTAVLNDMPFEDALIAWRAA